MSAMQLAAMPQEGLHSMWALKGDLTEPEIGFTIYLSTVYVYIIYIYILLFSNYTHSGVSCYVHFCQHKSAICFHRTLAKSSGNAALPANLLGRKI